MYDLRDKLDTDRWLCINKLISPSFKNNLIMYGYLCNDGVDHVECMVDCSNSTISYILVLTEKVYNKYQYCLKNRNSTFFITKWKIKRIVNKFGPFDFKASLRKNIQSYTIFSWDVGKVEIKSIKEFNNE